MTSTTTRPISAAELRNLELQIENEYYLARRPEGEWGTRHFSGLGLSTDWGITDGYQTWKV